MPLQNIAERLETTLTYAEEFILGALRWGNGRVTSEKKIRALAKVKLCLIHVAICLNYLFEPYFVTQRKPVEMTRSPGTTPKKQVDPA